MKQQREKNLDSVDDDVGGGGDNEQEVGEVDQPGMIQRDCGTFEGLRRANQYRHRGYQPVSLPPPPPCVC